MKMYSGYNVLKKLVGHFVPVGETWEDEKRLENLREYKNILDDLVDDLIYVSKFSDRDEASMQEIGATALDILLKIKERIDDEVTEDIE